MKRGARDRFIESAEGEGFCSSGESNRYRGGFHGIEREEYFGSEDFRLPVFRLKKKWMKNASYLSDRVEKTIERRGHFTNYTYLYAV